MQRAVQAQRAVVGGGLFGCFAALILADMGNDVVLIERDEALLNRASLVNQARLHTGLHYPRSLVTASESLRQYSRFRTRWPTAVRDFTQIYAVARWNSKTTGEDFAAFINRLGIEAEEVDPEVWFHRSSVSRAFKVDEPTFDVSNLREILGREIAARPSISVHLGTSVLDAQIGGSGIEIVLDSGMRVECDRLVLAAYAGTNALRDMLGLDLLHLRFELAEVLLGSVRPPLEGLGFTVMDGPFWSLMPFGHSGDVSLTSVGLTPLASSMHRPDFACQSHRNDCTSESLQVCSTCPVRPSSGASHQQQQMSMFLRHASAFEPKRSMLTVKTVLTSTEVDDARPTLIRHDADRRVLTVLSGKVSTLFDLEEALS